MSFNPKLIAEEGEQKGLVLSLEGKEEWFIGRDPDLCEITINDPATSRQHLVLRTTAEGILLENLSMTNPTEINGEPIETPRILTTGDTVRIGTGTFRFYETTEQHISEEDFVISTNEEEETPTLFEDDYTKEQSIDFDIHGTGRFLLKVINGPNHGAEFSMENGKSYLIGTDPATADIVFHDTSVSRQHAKITIDEEGEISITDLNSKNGTFLDGEKITQKEPLKSNSLVSIGTTSFIIFDREGEMQTIIAPLLPALVKSLKDDSTKEKPETPEEIIVPPTAEIQQAAELAVKETVVAPTRKESRFSLGGLIILSILTGLFVISGLGIMLLFQGEPIEAESSVNYESMLAEAMKPFPDVKYSFNKTTGRLLIVGHVLTGTERNQLIYNLQGFNFIKSVDDSGIIIDEYVWREINQILARNRAWKGISIQAPSAGQFILSGYLKTRREAEDLEDYLNANFPYPDLLEKKIVVEENVLNAINSGLRAAGIRNVTAEMTDGIITLTGSISSNQMTELEKLTNQFKVITGVRGIKSYVTETSSEKTMVNISDSYKVSGVSRIGTNLSVVINGRILAKDDILDGMKITEINNNNVILEKDGVKYRIDY